MDIGSILPLVILAVLCEAFVQIIKVALKNVNLGKEIKFLISLVVGCGMGIIYTWQTQTSILKLLGMPVRSEVLDMITTGILVGRGANFIHTLADLFKKYKEKIGGPIDG